MNIPYKDITNGMLVTINSGGDICMDKSVYKWIGKPCIVNKITKSGLIEVYRKDSPKERRSFAYNNISE